MQSVDVSELVQAVRLCIWRTGHEIADTIATAVLADIYFGKDRHDNDLVDACTSWSETERMPWMDWADLHIAYGILRGTSDIFRMAQAMGKPFICIDRGYWKPGHYDGYYRISLNGTQQTTGLDKLEPDYERWDKLGLEILPAIERSGKILVCPPTLAVERFFDTVWHPAINLSKCIIREKNSQHQLQEHLDASSKVITFNSSVGWEALRQGIPCESDSCFSFVGAYKQYFDHGNFMDVDSRRRMMAVQASLQLTLDEVRQGLLWPLIQKLVTSTSGTTTEKKSAAM